MFMWWIPYWAIKMDGGIASRLKQFDAYPKTLEDFRVKTFGGAIGKFWN